MCPNCACGEIGRRARLRIWWFRPCRFESYQAHTKKQHGTVRKGGAVLVLCLFLGPEDLPRLRNEAGAEVGVGLAFGGVDAGEE